MSSRSLLLQLPRDILHSVYSEWLSSWRDLSCLDVGCVGKGDREAWLCSLSEVKMRNRLAYRVLSDESMRMWYEWVISRKVLMVEMFPLRLRALGNSEARLDFGSHGTFIRSIELDNSVSRIVRHLDSSMLTALEQSLYLFVRECIHLEEMYYSVSEEDSEVNDLVFSALRKGLEANTLQKVYINIQSYFIISSSNVNMICEFLADHLLTIQDIEFISEVLDEESVYAIMSIFHERISSPPLKRLCLWGSYLSLSKFSQYLSTTIAMYLEVLEIGRYCMVYVEDVMTEEILSNIGRSCPMLRSFKIGLYDSFTKVFTVRKLYQFYEICPYLITFSCSAGSTDNMAVSIKVDDNNLNELCYDIYGLTLSTEEKEMFVECMYLAIQRSSNKLVGIVFGMDLLKQHDEWILLKSKLSPYLTGLVGKMSEWMLIEAVKEFPHLDRLQVILEEDNKLSDLSLAALMEYGRGLKKLCIYNSSRYRSQVYSFSDEMVSMLIERCEMLEELTLPGLGYESVLAVKHHSRLREVHLLHVQVSKEEMADMLLLDVVKESDEKCVWRRLRKGEISGRGYTFSFDDDNDDITTRCWVEYFNT